ncbi:uncharacterized protein [Cicer arietinum]|uniref:Uncharacterized protein LOC101496405 n=1 Tax=Cicer arietinum TaxID=3827 RepID=A0A1S2XSS6_CICAR|nr:uncharacterized protein LOC101496405 [Cicer arietinum]
MSNHPRLQNVRSTAQLFRESTSSFTSNPFTFFFLTILIFSFRTIVENGTSRFITFVDRDPSVKSLLSRLDISGNANHHHRQRSSQYHPSPAALRRRRPFLHLTRVGTLDDDFFSGDDDDGRTLFGSNSKAPVNGSFVAFGPFATDSGFSDLVADNGVRVLEVVRSGITLKAEDSSIDEEKDDDEVGGDDVDDEKEERKKEKSELGNGNEEIVRSVDLQLFVKGLEIGRRDTAAFFFLLGSLSVAYGWVIMVFLVTYSCVLGVVIVTVVNDFIGRFSFITGVVWDGSRLGLKRISAVVLIRWAVRDAVTQIIGIWYFAEIEDQFSFFKLFVRLKLMPFSVMSPWVRGFEKEISGFLFTWFLIDTFVTFIFSVDFWVALEDFRRGSKEIVKEGCYLLSSMLSMAIQVKCLEAILCGSFARWVLARVCGRDFAKIFQSTMEVYFMVTWLVFYFAAKCRDANQQGRRFGQREMEGLIDGHR